MRSEMNGRIIAHGSCTETVQPEWLVLLTLSFCLGMAEEP